MNSKPVIIEKSIEDFPYLTKKHIHAALDYASSITKESYAIISTEP